MTDSRDDEGYKSQPASLYIPPDSPINYKKIPLDDNHTCPVCDGKGFVMIVEEREVPRKRDVLGKLPGLTD